MLSTVLISVLFIAIVSYLAVSKSKRKLKEVVEENALFFTEEKEPVVVESAKEEPIEEQPIAEQPVVEEPVVEPKVPKTKAAAKKKAATKKKTAKKPTTK